MTNFEKMKYLHRNAGKGQDAMTVEKKSGKTADKKAVGRKKACQQDGAAQAGDGGTSDEGCSSNPAKDIPG